MNNPSFGGVIVKQDKRDFDLHKYNQNQLGSSIVIPPVYRPDYSSIPVDMQGKQPACGAHAGAFLRAVYLLKRGVTNPHLSPRYLWKQIKAIDGFPLSAGTDIYSILKTLKNKGTCDFVLTDNDVNLSLTDYTNLQVTPTMIASATKNEIENYATTFKPTWQQIKESIYVNGACLMLMRVGANMYRPDWTHNLPLSPSAYPLDSGHFITAIGYDEKYIYFRNEWSTSWGINGDGYIGEEYVSHIDSIASIVDKEKVTPDIIPVAPLPTNVQRVVDTNKSWTSSQIDLFLSLLRKWKVIK